MNDIVACEQMKTLRDALERNERALDALNILVVKFEQQCDAMKMLYDEMDKLKSEVETLQSTLHKPESEGPCLTEIKMTFAMRLRSIFNILFVCESKTLK